IGDRDRRIAFAPSPHRRAGVRPPPAGRYPARSRPAGTNRIHQRVVAPTESNGRSGAPRFGVVGFDSMQDLREKKRRGERVTAVTAYDYPTARLLDESGIDVILVGDSLGMVVLGYEDTTQVTLDEMLHHTRAVARGVKRALIVADMPIHSYDTAEQSVETARLVIRVGAQAVKLEGGVNHVPQIEAIVSAGIPFMGHIGMLPQGVREEGGYKVK